MLFLEIFYEDKLNYYEEVLKYPYLKKYTFN